MVRGSLSLARLVHENLSIVMCFAYSRKPLSQMMEARFKGYWKYLEKALFEVSAERAEKACLELALFLRTLDDDEEISDYHKITRRIPACGSVYLKDGSSQKLTFREVTNKIIHASRLEWDFTSDEPQLICIARTSEKWTKAEVDLVAFAAVCGQLMS
jgi:hypothetical protein